MTTSGRNAAGTGPVVEDEEEDVSSIVVCVSRSHGNTRKIADAMANVLDARVVSPADVDAAELAFYDLVGFGSGVYAMTLDGELRALVDALPPGEGRHVFVFATSGAPELPWLGFTRQVCNTLESKGYRLDGTFTCRGWDTWGPLGCIGGINRGHPDARDLRRAEGFVADLRDRPTKSAAATGENSGHDVDVATPGRRSRPRASGGRSR